MTYQPIKCGICRLQGRLPLSLCVRTDLSCLVCGAPMRRSRIGRYDGGERTMCGDTGGSGDAFEWHNYYFDDPATHGMGVFIYKSSENEEHVEHSICLYKLPRKPNSGVRARRRLYRARLVKSWGYWREEQPPVAFDIPVIDIDLTKFDPKHPRWLIETINSMALFCS